MSRAGDRPQVGAARWGEPASPVRPADGLAAWGHDVEREAFEMTAFGSGDRRKALGSLRHRPDRAPPPGWCEAYGTSCLGTLDLLGEPLSPTSLLDLRTTCLVVRADDLVSADWRPHRWVTRGISRNSLFVALVVPKLEPAEATYSP